MRRRNAAALVGGSVVLGALTGAYVLPAGGWTGPTTAAPPPATATDSPVASREPSPGPTPPSSGSPSPTPSATPTPTPTATPTTKLTKSDLLTVQSFTEQGVAVTSEPADGKPDPKQDATLCVDDDANTGVRTLVDLTGHEAALEGWWAQTDNGATTHQLLVQAADPTDAATSVDRLVAAQLRCQHNPAKHWVYGRQTTQDFSSTRSATWFGYYPAEQNTDGRAPDGVQPCGGQVFARNGARFTIVTVSMCLSSDQLAALAGDASERLG